MALEFQYRAFQRYPERAAVFPGAWNPPTVAHLAIARAARREAGQVIWILPRAFPHKPFEGAGFENRVEMLRLIASAENGFSVAISDGGLYLDIANETRASLGTATEILLVCGRDAAERIAAWDYGEPGVFDRMIERYRLLVAGRAGEYLPASHHAERITQLEMESSFDEVSSTEVRARIERGEDWRRLVPPPIESIVAKCYVPGSTTPR